MKKGGREERRLDRLQRQMLNVQQIGFRHAEFPKEIAEGDNFQKCYIIGIEVV